MNIRPQPTNEEIMKLWNYLGYIMYYDNNLPAVQNIHSMFTNDSNKIVIQLFEYNPEQKKLFQDTIIESPFIIFSEILVIAEATSD